MAAVKLISERANLVSNFDVSCRRRRHCCRRCHRRRFDCREAHTMKVRVKQNQQIEKSYEFDSIKCSFMLTFSSALRHPYRA